MIRLPGVSGSCSGGGGEKEQGWVAGRGEEDGGGIWKLGVRHGGKPSVAWKPVGNICKYSHPAF